MSEALRSELPAKHIGVVFSFYSFWVGMVREPPNKHSAAEEMPWSMGDFGASWLLVFCSEPLPICQRACFGDKADACRSH